MGSYQELSEKYNYISDSKNYNGKVYGIPASAYVSGILYNKEVFDKAGITDTPKTIDEFLQDLQMIKERTDAIPFYTNYSSEWTLQYWEMFTYLEMTGNPDYRNNDFFYYRNPFSQGTAHYKVYKLLYDIVAEGLCEENPKASDWELCKKMLNKGEIGCIAIGSWAVPQFMRAGENGNSIAFMPFPNNIDGKQYMTISADYSYAINAKSEHKEAARAFIDYMLDESGYALDNQAVSIVKTDPYPDTYGDMSNVVMLNNSSSTNINYSRKNVFYSKLNLDDSAHVARVIESAAGYSDETFDEIIEDWNVLWESIRPSDMVDELLEYEFLEDELQESTESQRFIGVIADEYEVSLSETEKAFVQECGTIKVGYLKNLAPFQYEDENGFEGLSRQLCTIVSETVGLQFEYVGFDSTIELLEALQNNSIQMAAGLEVRKELNDSLRFSRQYMEYMQVVAKNDTTDVENLEEKCEACVAGDKFGQDNEEQQTNCVNTDTIEEALSAVDSKTADFMVGNYYSVDYYIKDLECEHVSVVPMSENGSMAFAFSLGADTRLISICNKCLYAIPESLIQMALMEYLDPPAKEVTLQRFIRDNPILVGGIGLAILLIVFLAIYMVLRQRWISEKKHFMEIKRYEILAALMDEYVFEYDIQKKQLHFDVKSQKQFGVEGDISEADYTGDNSCVNVLLEEIKKAQKEEGEYNSNPNEI
ncbi:MAG: extracellular solute-binding protein, partial [Lachnospiraceae bacterium]